MPDFADKLREITDGFPVYAKNCGKEVWFIMESGFAVPVSISEAARIVGIDPDKARYWLKLLEVETTKAGKSRCVAPDAVTLLAAMNNLVTQGTSPSDAARIAKDSPIETKPMIPEKAEKDAIQAQLEEMKKAFLLMGETFKVEIQSLKNEIRNLAEENKHLRVQLLPPPEDPPKQIIPWHPETAQDPLEGMSWFQRAYVQVFEPQKMRRYDS